MKITGTWIFNETLSDDQLFYNNANHDVGFVKPLAFGIEFNFRYYSSAIGATEEFFTFNYYGSNGGTMSMVTAYDSRTGWVSEYMRTVEFADDADLADEPYAWFIANAVPVSTVQRNPSAMLLGFQVGQAIRRMRGQETWETLWEGEATTEAVSTNAIYTRVGDPTTAARFQSGDTIALTVDGVRKTFVAESTTSVGAVVGNVYLYDRTSEDIGYDYYVSTNLTFGWHMSFGSRNPGTYSVKIERMKK